MHVVGLCAVVAAVRSSGMAVVCLSEPLVRRMSSANSEVGELRVAGIVLSKSDFVVGLGSTFSDQWFHDVL